MSDLVAHIHLQLIELRSLLNSYCKLFHLFQLILLLSMSDPITPIFLQPIKLPSLLIGVSVLQSVHLNPVHSLPVRFYLHIEVSKVRMHHGVCAQRHL